MSTFNPAVLPKALEEIRLKKKNLASVSRQFNIPETTLRRHLIKHQKEDLSFAEDVSHLKKQNVIDPILISKALEELRLTQRSIASVARKFGITRKTLGNHVKRHTKEDSSFAADMQRIKEKNNREPTISKALEELKLKQNSIKSVARQFGISHSLLHKYVTKRRKENFNFAASVLHLRTKSDPFRISNALEEMRLKQKSIASVARQFNISKNTLLGYVLKDKKKNINYTADVSHVVQNNSINHHRHSTLISKALEEIRLKQKSVASVSCQFDIPETTLRRHLIKHQKEDSSLATTVSHLKKQKVLDPTLISKALEEIRLNKKSIASVARQFDISSTTLVVCVKKRIKEDLNYAADMSHLKAVRGVDPALISKALEEIKLTQRTISSVARQFGISKATLFKYVIKHKQEDSSYTAYLNQKHVFDDYLEQKLISYILNFFHNSASIHNSFDVNFYDICKLAYEFAVLYKLKIPKEWTSNKSAGSGWYDGFKKRHPTLAIKILKFINLSQSEKSYQDSVEILFDAFEQLVLKYKLNLNNIYYVNSIAVLNKHTFADDKKKIDGSKIIFLTISAAAKVLPHFSSIVQKDCSNQDLTEKDTFLEYLEHLIKHGKFSRKTPCLLLTAYNNFGMTLKSAKVAADNGIVILEFPENYPQELKPLNLIHNSLLKTLDDKTRDVALLNVDREIESVIQHENINKVCKLVINFSDEN